MKILPGLYQLVRVMELYLGVRENTERRSRQNHAALLPLCAAHISCCKYVFKKKERKRIPT